MEGRQPEAPAAEVRIAELEAQVADLSQKIEDLTTALCWLAEVLGPIGKDSSGRGANVITDQSVSTISRRARGVE